MLFQKLQDFGRGKRAHHTVNFEAVKHEDKSGDRRDAEPPGDFLEVLGVHLDDYHLALGARGDFFQFGGDHFAGAAPFGPEIDEDRQAGLADQCLELLVRGDVNGLRRKIEGVFAFPALHAFLKCLESKPIPSAAGRAIQ